ncbi:hypothetical protein B6U83_04970 [Thermoplasmatales archaeon ex4484_36]|nr:MAG: hypothetical protein B6U83_04970 [Thermoplasmatales archaeon ex4484_36]
MGQTSLSAGISSWHIPHSTSSSSSSISSSASSSSSSSASNSTSSGMPNEGLGASGAPRAFTSPCTGSFIFPV